MCWVFIYFLRSEYKTPGVKHTFLGYHLVNSILVQVYQCVGFLLLVLGGRWFGLVVIGSSVIVQAYALLTNRVRIVSSISFLALLFDFGRFCRFISSQH